MGWHCDCGKVFGSRHARYQHMNALGHCLPTRGCDRCQAMFTNRSDAVSHMNFFNHWRHECSLCTHTRSTKDDIRQHEVEAHYYCSECGREFQSLNNIKMHLNSRIHRGTNLDCPFCKGSYTTAAGLAHHLESGSCPNAPNLNRDELYKAIRSRDPSGVITKKLIGWQGSTHYEATTQTWNGYYYECYFCHRQFNTLPSLNQHLQSPIHQQKLYHCPNRAGCGKEFTSLAGVSNHLESESCGFMRFESVQSNFQGIMGGNRLIGFHS
ncbi:hypothetical protein F5Y19DRAFT_25785 [Xylariaceae sp. FL1651]|nr:hypothetical protein F5Y19DRAFT_25785 [Xylariaceae sp. FL1651]